MSNRTASYLGGCVSALVALIALASCSGSATALFPGSDGGMGVDSSTMDGGHTGKPDSGRRDGTTDGPSQDGRGGPDGRAHDSGADALTEAGPTCNADAGLALCAADGGSKCTDLSLDPSNCGTCGKSCGGDAGVLCVNGSCTSCGGPLQPCCSGATCSLTNTVCDPSSNTCQLVCGVLGNPCCTTDGGATSDAGGGTCQAAAGDAGALTCQTGTCVACGGENEACCPGQSCKGASLVCSPSDQCVACGADGEECCAGNTCGPNETCAVAPNQPTGRQCECGNVGQACCVDNIDGFSGCHAGACVDGDCVACGADGQPCCDGDTCNVHETCVTGLGTASGNQCQCGNPPGANPGQACCVDNIDGFSGCHTGVCSSTSDQCVNCGGTGEPCCTGGACSTGNVCNSNDTCVACGGTGQPCCLDGSGNKTCNANETCSNGTCQCGTSGTACCGGTTCMGNENCSGGVCGACGGDEQACCTTGTACTNGATCTNGTCPCGGPGQPCCGGTSCAVGTCTQGKCPACGADGQICCAGNKCNANETCDTAANQCQCGNAGQACCVDNIDGFSGCHTGTTCTGANCEACGGADEPCCGPPNPCSALTSCCSSLPLTEQAVCEAVVAEGNAGACTQELATVEASGNCTNGNPPACGSSLTCNDDLCTACGGINETCCAGSKCTSGACVNGSCQCGGQNEPCCSSGNACQSGLDCSGGSCVCGQVGTACCNIQGQAQCQGNQAFCSNGTCEACGSDGQPCCPRSTCFGNETCNTSNNQCECGNFGYKCCDGNHCSSPFLLCTGDVCI